MNQFSRRLPPVCALFFALLFFVSCGAADQKLPTARKGILDLRGMSLESSGSILLNGEWEFYWNEFLHPQHFESLDGAVPLYAEVPGVWNDIEIDGKKIGPDGYATYRLTVLLEAETPSLALKFVEAATAATVYVNGREIATSGTVGKNRSQSIPAYVPRTAKIDTDGPELEIVLHVSNFHHRTGGARRELRLGSAALLERTRLTRLFSDAFVFGIIVAAGFLHLGFFLARRERRAFLFFWLICVLILFRALTTSERFLIQMMPSISWEGNYRLEYLSFFLLLPAFAYYLRSLFPDEIRRWATTLNLGITLAFSLVVLVTHVRFFSRILIFFQVYTSFVLVYGAILLIRAVKRKREGSIAMVVGFLLFVGVVFNDLLYATGLIKSLLLSPIGLFVFIILQSGFLTLQYSRAFEIINRQRGELTRHRDGLEKLVDERTKKLESAMWVAEKASAAKSEFLAHMSHELRTPLNHIYGFAQLLGDEKIGTLNETQTEFLSDILSSGRHLLGLIDRVLDLTKVESGRLELDVAPLRVADLIGESVSMVEARARQLGIKISISGADTLPPINGDITMLKQVILNILDNAMKFSPDGGSVKIEGHKDENNITITITDSGIGIEENYLERVFEPLEQHDRTGRYAGAGIGMALARRYMELHNGSLAVYSEGIGKGAAFVIVIPLG